MKSTTVFSKNNLNKDAKGTIVLTSSGVSSQSGSIRLNTPSDLRITNGQGITTSSGTSLNTPSIAPSTEATGFTISGSIAGVKPPAPIITHIELSNNPGEVYIHFKRSPIDCGSEITGLTFIPYSGRSPQISQIQKTSSTVSPYTFNGLTPSQTYTFEMFASTSSCNEGERSAQSSEITVGSVPEAPTISIVFYKMSTKYRIHLSTPLNDRGYPILLDETEVDINGTVYKTTILTPTYFIGKDFGSPGLPELPGGHYNVKVRIKNLMGYSEWSPNYHFSASSPPSQPVITSAVYLGGGDWNVYYDVPHSGGVSLNLYRALVDLRYNNDVRVEGSPFTTTTCPQGGDGYLVGYPNPAGLDKRGAILPGEIRKVYVSVYNRDNKQSPWSEPITIHGE